MNEKIVGKKAEPTAEELEFIYERLPRLSDQEVLEEMQDTEFPRRSPGFIKRRRREFNTARKILQTQLEREVNPTIMKRKEEHFAGLIDIAHCLLANDLDTVLERVAFTRISSSGEEKATHQAEYALVSRTDGTAHELTSEQLSNHLDRNIEVAVQRYSDWFFCECFLPHLESELPADLGTKGFGDIVKEQPYQLVETLRVLAARGIFRGTCPVCKDSY
jgi:hypothetical protein